MLYIAGAREEGIELMFWLKGSSFYSIPIVGHAKIVIFCNKPEILIYEKFI